MSRLGRTPAPAWMPDFIPADVTTACHGADPELFFPIGEHYSDEGRRICYRCVVKRECADWAIQAGERFGLYGGLDPFQRTLRARTRELTS